MIFHNTREFWLFLKEQKSRLYLSLQEEIKLRNVHLNNEITLQDDEIWLLPDDWVMFYLEREVLIFRDEESMLMFKMEYL